MKRNRSTRHEDELLQALIKGELDESRFGALPGDFAGVMRKGARRVRFRRVTTGLLAIALVATILVLAPRVASLGDSGSEDLPSGSDTAASPDSGSPPLPDGWTTYRDEELKFSASYPTEWNRATSALTDLINPHELIVLGSGPLEPGGECAPTASIDAMETDDVLIYLLEDGKGPAGDEPSRPPNFAFSKGAREPMECVGDPAQADVYSFLFTDSGRAFDATVIVGSAAEVTKRNDVLQVLDRLQFFSSARP